MSASRSSPWVQAFILVLLVLAGTSWAQQVVREGYATLTALPALSSTISAVQTTTWTTALAPRNTNGSPTTNVVVYFTAENATADLRVGFYVGTGFLFSSGPVTFTAADDDPVDIDGTRYYTSQVESFDTRAVTAIDVRVTGAISDGALKWRAWGHGVNGTP